ncbi:hypothetical protein, partial [Ruminococcus sp.]|uniref:hypothetical protein n=1 Tax=Ruminococcus sp. TaxID=41978 RepID=UPI0038656E62
VLFATLSISAAAAENSYGINYPTKAEIFAKAKELGIDFSTAETFNKNGLIASDGHPDRQFVCLRETLSPRGNGGQVFFLCHEAGRQPRSDR